MIILYHFQTRKSKLNKIPNGFKKVMFILNKDFSKINTFKKSNIKPNKNLIKLKKQDLSFYRKNPLISINNENNSIKQYNKPNPLLINKLSLKTNSSMLSIKIDRKRSF